MLKIPLSGVRSLIANGERAQSKLVEKNVRLVIHLADHYRHRGLPFPDLVQEGMIGLIKAVTKYDPDRGFKFSTYAAFWITNSILRAISEKSRIVRLPRRLHTAVVTIIRAEKQFARTHSRAPSPAELAKMLNISVEDVTRLTQSRKHVIGSLDNAMFHRNSGDVPPTTFKDALASPTLEPSTETEAKYTQWRLRASMHSLSDREFQVVDLRFGLCSGRAETLEEVGKRFGVSRERVRQIQQRAMQKLKTAGWAQAQAQSQLS